MQNAYLCKNFDYIMQICSLCFILKNAVGTEVATYKYKQFIWESMKVLTTTTKKAINKTCRLPKCTFKEVKYNIEKKANYNFKDQ